MGATGDLEPDAELELAGLTVRTLHTPGHTNGMLSLLIEGNVFTGDTLFKNSVGGVRAPGSTSYEDLKHSIMDVLLKLPPETVIRPGHTDPTTVADELEHNRFVRIWRGARRGGRGALHRARRAGDADPARRRLRRRPQGLGALARRPRRHRARARRSSVRALRSRPLAWRGMAHEPEQKSSGGLSLQTLLISAAAAVAAATIVPMIWERGTIFATAMTPVIVALVSEGLRKPVERVSTVAPRVARRSGTGAAVRRSEPAAARTRDPERVGARGEGRSASSRCPAPARRRAVRPRRRPVRAAQGPAHAAPAAEDRARSPACWRSSSRPASSPRPSWRCSAARSPATAARACSAGRSRRARAQDDAKDRRPRPTATPDAGRRRRRRRRRRPPRRPPTATPTPSATASPAPTPSRSRRRPRPDVCGSDGEGPDPDLAAGAHREGLEPRGRAGSAPARHPRREPRAHARRAATRRSSAATSRPPSRSSPRWGR